MNIEIINEYDDIICDYAQACLTVEDLNEDEKNLIAHYYIKYASIDEKFDVFTQTFGKEWAGFLGDLLTERMSDRGVNMIKGEVFRFIESIVERDLNDCKEDLDPPDNTEKQFDTIQRAMDIKETLSEAERRGVYIASYGFKP